MKSEIMYIECKASGLSNPGRIVRVRFSKSGKTIKYRGLKLQSLKGTGYKANFFNTETGLHYWVSKPHKDGRDSLYPQKVSIDADVSDEYWLNIRQKPEYADQLWFKSPGKDWR